MSLVLGFNDLMVAILSFISYVVLYVARFISVAVFHFMWLFLSIISPVLILFHLFRGTSQITVNLFKSLIEVASYKIVWAVLSAMITSLSFGNAYAADGNYLTVIVLNFVIGLAMLGTPLIVRALVGEGLSGMSDKLGMGAVTNIAASPARAVQAVQMGREVLSNTIELGSRLHDFGGRKSEQMGGSRPYSSDRSSGVETPRTTQATQSFKDSPSSSVRDSNPNPIASKGSELSAQSPTPKPSPS